MTRSRVLWVSCGGRGARMGIWPGELQGAVPKHALPLPRPGGTLIGEITRRAAGHFGQIRMSCSRENAAYFRGMFGEVANVLIDVDTEMTGALGPALRHALQARERTYLCAGDVFCDAPWEGVEAFHDAHGLPVTIVVAEIASAESAACFKMEGHRVVAFCRGSPPDGRAMINVGMYIIDATEEVVRRISRLDRHTEDAFFASMTDAGLLAAYIPGEAAFNVNTPATYRRVLDRAARRDAPPFVATVRLNQGRLPALVELGFRHFRVNFGRRDPEENLAAIQECRSLTRARGSECTLLADLPGLKYRIGRLERGEETCRPGDAVALTAEEGAPGSRARIPGVSRELIDAVQKGDRLLAGQGAMMQVEETRGGTLVCQVIQGGRLFNRCGVQIVGRHIPRTHLTFEDRRLIPLLGEVDLVCPSFVDCPDMVQEARASLPSGSPARLIAKIESPWGVDRMQAIADASDGLMLARGDLGAHYSAAEMREIGREMLRIARGDGKLVFFATDYFAEMAAGAPAPGAADEAELAWAMAAGPAGIVLNETASSPHWLDIARCAQGLSRTGAGGGG